MVTGIYKWVSAVFLGGRSLTEDQILKILNPSRRDTPGNKKPVSPKSVGTPPSSASVHLLRLCTGFLFSHQGFRASCWSHVFGEIRTSARTSRASGNDGFQYVLTPTTSSSHGRLLTQQPASSGSRGSVLIISGERGIRLGSAAKQLTSL